jgi:asparagine synthase (glutamine-hydrolysing)
MCGIAGFFSRKVNAEEAQKILSTMAAALRHRGPDGEGQIFDKVAAVGLAHRRLSVLDLRHVADQPMRSPSGRFSIVYNGEIYNHLELRASLELEASEQWKTTSDTETILVCVERYGIHDTLRKLRGMFAFAILDHELQRLYLARDRAGEKPLYYGWVGQDFYFASDLGSIESVARDRLEINREALTLFLRLGFVPGPMSIYKDIFKLPPADFLTFELVHSKQQVASYWSLDLTKPKQDLDLHDQMKVLDSLLRDSVRGQMLSDVELGAFLSGGVDSSLVVSYMQELSSRPIKTYCIGFDQERVNEARYARHVATHFGTEHHELIVKGIDALSIIPEISKIYSEPFADPSQIPTIILSRFAKREVTVALSGDGGDELFGGYPHYTMALKLWALIERIPYSLRQKAGHFAKFIPPGTLEMVGKVLRRIPQFDRVESNLDEKKGQLIRLLRSKTFEELYRRILYPSSVELVLDSCERTTRFLTSPGSSASFLDSMLLEDQRLYLPDDILTKVDRASMSCSLEVRAPMLDYKILEYSWSLPFDLKMRRQQGKFILKELLKTKLPLELVDRPKMGFRSPIKEWMKADLNTWGQDLIGSRRVLEGLGLNPSRIEKVWADFNCSRNDESQLLWNLLMLVSWAHERKL